MSDVTSWLKSQSLRLNRLADHKLKLAVARLALVDAQIKEGSGDGS